MDEAMKGKLRQAAEDFERVARLLREAIGRADPADMVTDGAMRNAIAVGKSATTIVVEVRAAFGYQPIAR